MNDKPVYDSVKYPAQLPAQCETCKRFWECTPCWLNRLSQTTLPASYVREAGRRDRNSK